ncbi:MAG TPA: NAD-dependent epimerase/dehydratase family protein [Pyrinomonadaceae bacterium]|nr:NAD-dependent epimerase/dehydratase family protein [Pyrinomonadaceae bacterium]
MKILITGISGFIGGSFGRYAAHLGHEVAGAGRNDDLEVLIRDFLPHVVVNAAGTASVAASLDDPLHDFRGSVQTCAHLLEAVRQSGKNPLVVIPSSAAVYGNPASLPVTEEVNLKPISPYGFHKAASELLAREYAECFGLKVMICRFFSVFGAAQRRLLVWELYQQLAGPEKIAWLSGTGEETRDFLYIDDLSTALLSLIENFSDEQPQVVNVASGTETSVLQLAETIRDLVAPEKEVRCRGQHRKNDPLRWWADISRLQKLLPSWQARTLNETLPLCIDSWRQTEQLSLQHGS